MRRTIERKFKGMSPRERRREVLRMQRIERAAKALLAKVDVRRAREIAGQFKGSGFSAGKGWISHARIRDLADALGMYEPNDGAKSKGD